MTREMMTNMDYWTHARRWSCMYIRKKSYELITVNCRITLQ